MARKAPRLPADDIREYNMTLANWKPGTITLLRENRTPPGAVVQSKNAIQVQDGVWRPKWGSAYYSIDLPSFRKGSPVVTTNLIPNPSFETNTTGWAAVGSATIAADTGEFLVGAKSLKITKSGTSTEGVASSATGAVTAATLYSGSMSIKAPLGLVMSFQMLHNGNVIGTTSVTGTGGWQRVMVSGVTGAGSFGIVLKLTWAVTGNVYIDAVQVELGANATGYIDGATASTASTDYAWTGTAHASTSTRSAYLYEPYNLDGSFPCVNPDKTVEILEVAGGVLYRSTDGGAKTSVSISGGALTAGNDCYFLQIRSFVYIGNNHDPLVRYDTTSKTAAGYTALGTPTAPTLAKTGLAGTTYRAYYVIVATNLVGSTVGSSEVSITVGKVRDEWATSTTAENTTDLVTVTITRLSGASRYSIFYSDESGKEVYLDSVPDPGTGTTFDYVDRGQVPPNDFVELPNDNTTGGPKLGQMELSTNRIWGLDGDNHNRVNWSGVGQYTGTFSPFYGGGYVDLELGGRERPTQVLHYRDGKGTAMATVLTIDPEGNGSTWQITLDTVTVGSVTFIVPNPVKIVGSIGASGGRAACKVVDDIVFGNLKGAYSLGSQPSLLNVLSTRELSANIRPDWRALSSAAMSKMASYYYDAKIFFAVPASASSNSQIWIRDTEQRNWQKGWEGVGVKSFFEYVDSTGHAHFMGVPAAGHRLIEFGPDIRGDLGLPFEVRIKTGLIPIQKNHNLFAQIDKIFVELGNLTGNVSVDMYGYDYKKGFIFLGNLAIVGGSLSSGVSWGYQWSTHQWSKVTSIPTLSSAAVYRRYKRINKLINSLQFVISCTGIGDYFELLEAAADGYLVKVEPPRAWKTGAVATAVNPDAITDQSGQPILI